MNWLNLSKLLHGLSHDGDATAMIYHWKWWPYMLLKVKRLNDIYVALLNKSSQGYEASLAIRDPPDSSHTGWYSIYLPRRDGRLSWPIYRWLVTYGYGLPAQLPIQPPGSNLTWCWATSLMETIGDQCANHYTTPSPLPFIIYSDRWVCTLCLFFVCFANISLCVCVTFFPCSSFCYFYCYCSY